MKTQIGILMMALGVITVSCKETKKDTVEENQEMTTNDHSEMEMNNNKTVTKARTITPTTAKNSATTEIITAYLSIKNSLVASNQEETAKAGENLLAAFSKFDMTKLSDDTHKLYMEISESAKEHTNQIIKTSLKSQREHFDGLSTDITDLLSLLGTDQVLFQDYCPMANNNGAYWLSEVKDIKNPYFGDEMMECGSVKKQIN